MEHRSDELRNIMKMAKIEMPFSDFEERLMLDIEKIEINKKSLSKTKAYALIFFIAGIVFGFGLNYLLTDLMSSAGLSTAVKNVLLLLSQIMYVLLIVLFSDKIYALVRLMKKKKSDSYFL